MSLEFISFLASAGQSGAEGGDPTNQLVMTALMFGGIIFIFYFMILRPQKKRQQEHQQLLAGLKKGDKIILSSGMHGRITEISDNVLTVQIADNVQVKVERASVTTVEPKD